MRWLWMASLAACGGGGSGDETGTDGAPHTQGACGAVHLEDQPVTVEGTVADSSYPPNPVPGATVQLEERNWYPTGKIFAEGTSGPDGAFTLVVDPGITVVDDCWGTAVDYWVSASLGNAYGETPVNSFLFNAIEGNAAEPADGVAELAVPLALEGTFGTTTTSTGTTAGSGTP